MLGSKLALLPPPGPRVAGEGSRDPAPWCALLGKPPQLGRLCSSPGQLNQIQQPHHQQMWVIDMVCLHNMNLIAIASTDQKIGESLTAPQACRQPLEGVRLRLGTRHRANCGRGLEPSGGAVAGKQRLCVVPRGPRGLGRGPGLHACPPPPSLPQSSLISATTTVPGPSPSLIWTVVS